MSCLLSMLRDVLVLLIIDVDLHIYALCWRHPQHNTSVSICRLCRDRQKPAAGTCAAVFDNPIMQHQRGKRRGSHSFIVSNQKFILEKVQELLFQMCYVRRSILNVQLDMQTHQFNLHFSVSQKLGDKHVIGHVYQTIT